MLCQQRKARGYSKRSRDVPAADLAPPAHALELIPERYRRPIARPVGIFSVVEVGENRRRDPMASGIPGGSSAALDFTVGEMTLLRPLIAGPPTLIRHTLSRGVVSGHRLVQARWRPEGLDGLGAHAHRPPRPGTTERLCFCRNPNG